MYKFFSIRSKILILLIFVSFTSGLALLNMSIKTFKNDKIASIFESNTNVASQLNGQLAKEIQTVNLNLLPYVSNYSKLGALSENSIDEIPQWSILSGVQIFKLVNSNTITSVSAIKKKEAKLISANEAELKTALLHFNESNNASFYFDGALFFLNRFAVGADNYVVAYYYKSETLAQFFGQESSYKLFLVNSDGAVILNNPSTSANFLYSNFSQLLKNSELINMSNTTKIKSDNQESWLLTTAQTPLSGLKLILLVSENSVLAAINQITNKSILVFIILSALVVIIGIFSANYLIATAHKSRMEAELKTAQAVQEVLFPKNEFESETIKIQGHYESASECGGDWWHYYENSDFIQFWIADATGHGFSAALLTSAAKSSVALIQDMGLTAAGNIKLLNKSICSISKDKLLMTCFHGIYDKNTRLFSYVNSSHEPPILFKSEESVYTKDSLVFLNENVNCRLGFSTDTEFTTNELQLDVGDRIYFYTDGVQDVANSDGKAFGERDHIKKLLQVFNKKNTLAGTLQDFLSSLESYRENSALVDDVTFFFMETK